MKASSNNEIRVPLPESKAETVACSTEKSPESDFRVLEITEIVLIGDVC